jgi:hypothetical protein
MEGRNNLDWTKGEGTHFGKLKKGQTRGGINANNILVSETNFDRPHRVRYWAYRFSISIRETRGQGLSIPFLCNLAPWVQSTLFLPLLNMFPILVKYFFSKHFAFIQYSK